MLKRCFAYLLMTLCCVIGNGSLEAQAKTNQAPSNQSTRPTDNGKYEEKMRIMEKDEKDDTDIFAIPLDDSEIEDEEELDRLEGKPFNPAKK